MRTDASLDCVETANNLYSTTHRVLYFSSFTSSRFGKKANDAMCFQSGLLIVLAQQFLISRNVRIVQLGYETRGSGIADPVPEKSLGDDKYCSLKGTPILLQGLVATRVRPKKESQQWSNLGHNEKTSTTQPVKGSRKEKSRRDEAIEEKRSNPRRLPS